MCAHFLQFFKKSFERNKKNRENREISGKIKYPILKYCVKWLRFWDFYMISDQKVVRKMGQVPI